MRLGYGFTLIELILALSLSLVVLSAAMLMLADAQQSFAALAASKRAEENLHLSFALIERALLGAGNFGCAEPQRPLSKMLRGDWSQLPEYNITRAVEGYDALPHGGLAPNPAATLPLSGVGGDRQVQHAGHGIDLDQLLPEADLLVVRGVGPWAPLGALQVGTAPIVVLGEALEFAVGDVVLVADCEQATVLKITAIETLAGGLKLDWAAGPGAFDNVDGLSSSGLKSGRRGIAESPGSYGADAIVARIEARFFYLAPSRVINRQGSPVTALWLKFGTAPGVELIAGIDDLQVWFLAATGAQPANSIGYFDAQHLPADARVVGVRVSIRSTSVHGLSEFANIPLTFRGARTFMLPQFAQQGWQL